ncbi:DNA polymerase/3'-5' exonuclease PolX [bacterium]|nr:MAG: DNA polymerase/3'-5' exonuclease PolX [bacterium]
MATTNKSVAQFLENIATYMRLAGENDFRSAAFDKAARLVETMDSSIEQFIQNGNLTDIKGIGQSIANDITSFSETGTAPVLEALKEKVPNELIKWLDISGMGPKKIYKIHKELGITTLEELKVACDDGRVAALAGMGAKSAEKILKSISWMEQFAERCRLDEAEAIAYRFKDLLKGMSGVKRIELAGSFRRKLETIGDIDVLIAADENAVQTIFDAFTTHESIVEVLGKGDTKSSVRVQEGRQVDLRIVAENEFDAALMYFTGSKEHNVVMRQRARDRGMALNEYGLFKLTESGETNFEERIPVYSEDEIYKALGLAWIPPELREDFGEFGSFEGDSSINLLNESDIKGVLHAHSTYSDGSYSIEQMALACIERGYEYLGLTDHSQTAAYAGGLNEKAVYKQWKEIDALNEKFAKEGVSFRIFKGIESDILANGDLDYSIDVLKGFDFIIASVHFSLEMEPEKMLERFKRATENPYTRIVGHPTGRLLLKREGNPFDMNALVEFAAEHNTAIEINASPWRLDLDWRYGRKAEQVGLLSSINPDAHDIEGIDDIRFGVAIARKARFTKNRILNALRADELKAWFENK